MTCQSNGNTATITPVMPPRRKSSRKPSENSIGVSRRTRPSHIVAIQQKNCTPLGMAMMRLAAEKNDIASTGTPVANMWCTHTPKLMKPIATSDAATQKYPASGRRANTGMIWLMMANAGMARM